MHAVRIVVVVATHLGATACGGTGATKLGAAAEPTPVAPTESIAQIEPVTPTAPPTHEGPKFKKLNAEEMCLSYSAIEEMSSVGVAHLTSIPAASTQLRILSSFSKKIPIRRVQVAASKTIASVQAYGTLDPDSSAVLAAFCAPYGG